MISALIKKNIHLQFSHIMKATSRGKLYDKIDKANTGQFAKLAKTSMRGHLEQYIVFVPTMGSI